MPQHDGRNVDAVDQVRQVVAELRGGHDPALQFIVDGRQLFIGRLQFFLGGFEFLVGALQLLVAGNDLFVGRFELLVDRLLRFDDRLQITLGRGAFTTSRFGPLTTA